MWNRLSGFIGGEGAEGQVRLLGEQGADLEVSSLNRGVSEEKVAPGKLI